MRDPEISALVLFPSLDCTTRFFTRGGSIFIYRSLAGNGTTPLHKKDVRYASAVIPTGDGVYRNVLLSSETAAGDDRDDDRKTRPFVHPAELVDQACRGLFPLGFFICNIFYWVYYLILTDTYSDE